MTYSILIRSLPRAEEVHREDDQQDGQNQHAPKLTARTALWGLVATETAHPKLLADLFGVCAVLGFLEAGCAVLAGELKDAAGTAWMLIEVIGDVINVSLYGHPTVLFGAVLGHLFSGEAGSVSGHLFHLTSLLRKICELSPSFLVSLPLLLLVFSFYLPHAFLMTLRHG